MLKVLFITFVRVDVICSELVHECCFTAINLRQLFHGSVNLLVSLRNCSLGLQRGFNLVFNLEI